MKSVFDHPTAILNWLDEPPGAIFMGDYRERLDYYRAQLEKEMDLVRLRQLQGKIAEVKELLNLHEELSKHVQFKAKGKVE